MYLRVCERCVSLGIPRVCERCVSLGVYPGCVRSVSLGVYPGCVRGTPLCAEWSSLPVPVSLLGKSPLSLLFPFHCWARRRASFLIPVSLLGKQKNLHFFPVSLLDKKRTSEKRKRNPAQTAPLHKDGITSNIRFTAGRCSTLSTPGFTVG